jgi:hypothetical protein
MPDAENWWVIVIAEIRDNATGKIREYECEDILGAGEPQPRCFMWEEGNYSCDCNRKSFFQRAAAEDQDDKEQRPCGDGGYAVRLRNKLTGRVYYDEFSTEKEGQ